MSKTGCGLIVAPVDDPVQHTLGIAKGAHGRPIRPTFPVRALPRAGRGVPPMRPGPTVLRRRLRSHDTQGVAAPGRRALPAQPHWAIQARLAYPALARAPSGAGKDSDASGFPRRALGCCTASHANIRLGSHPTMHLHDIDCGHSRRPSPRLALPLVLCTLRSPGAPGIHPSQPQSNPPPWP